MDCIGLPLQFVIDVLNHHNCIVDWVDFIDYTIDKNWNVMQTFSKIEESLIDVFDREYSDQVLLRLRYYLTKKYS